MGLLPVWYYIYTEAHKVYGLNTFFKNILLKMAVLIQEIRKII